MSGTPGRRFLCLFWRETKQRPELKISYKTGSGGEKICWQRNLERGSWQRNPERGCWQRNPERVSWQWNPERVSWRRETQRGCRERTAEGTSQDELAVQSGQRSAEVGSEEDSQRRVGIPCGFRRSFAKNTLPAIVYKMHEKLYKKVSQNYPSCTWSWPKSISFVCSFSPTHSVVFLVAVKKCVIPLSEPTGWITFYFPSVKINLY